MVFALVVGPMEHCGSRKPSGCLAAASTSDITIIRVGQDHPSTDTICEYHPKDPYAVFIVSLAASLHEQGTAIAEVFQTSTTSYLVVRCMIW